MKNRNFGLDVIRAAAIVFVLFNHVINYFLSFPRSTILGNIGGFLGVELFFVLSGFLIGRILLTQFQHHISTDTIKIFYIRRWFRTLPLYYFLLIIFVISSILITKQFDLHILHFFFLQNLSSHALNFFSVSWSLVIEEWFYLLLPLLLLLRYKLGWFKNHTLPFLLGVVILITVLRFGYIYLFNPDFDEMRKNIFLRFDSLLIGVLLAGIKLRKDTLYRKLQSTPVFLLGMTLICGCAYVYGWLFAKGVIDTWGWGKALLFPILSVSIAATIPFLETSKLINGVFARFKPLYWLVTWISILSYSLYLIHLNIFDTVKYFLLDKIDLTTMMVISLGIAFLASYILYRCIEQPFMRMREKYSKPGH